MDLAIAAMRSIATTTAMLSVMLLHAAFGCGWHHAHAVCDGRITCPTGAAAERAHDHHEHHAHDGDGAGGNHSHAGGDESPCRPERPTRDHQDCCEDCQFLAGSHVELPPAGSHWVGADLSPADAILLRAAQHGERLGHHLFNGDAPPGYRRPLICIWLI